MCNYNFNLPVDPTMLMETAKAAIEKRGGTTTVQGSKLLFSVPTPVGQIDGACHLLEQSMINIKVTKKPDIVPCALIREKLVGYLTEAVKSQAKLAQV